MIVVASIFAIVFVWAFCFRLSSVFGGLTFSIYRGLGLASDRETFVRRYGWFMRIVGSVIIVGILIALVANGMK
jgi:hypothetical protein